MGKLHTVGTRGIKGRGVYLGTREISNFEVSVRANQTIAERESDGTMDHTM